MATNLLKSNFIVTGFDVLAQFSLALRFVHYSFGAALSKFGIASFRKSCSIKFSSRTSRVSHDLDVAGLQANSSSILRCRGLNWKHSCRSIKRYENLVFEPSPSNFLLSVKTIENRQCMMARSLLDLFR